MTDQMRIAVAESVGWKWYRRPATGPWAAKPHRALYHPSLSSGYTDNFQLADMTERECNAEFLWREGMIPDYPNDLNAMHEVEKTLRENQFHFVDYIRELWRVVHPSIDYTGELGYIGFEFITATARQRCEAYLRTKGLWKR